MKINRKIIREYYENLISDIENEQVAESLLDDFEEIDDLILLLEDRIEDELDAQSNDIPSLSEEIKNFETNRKSIMLPYGM